MSEFFELFKGETEAQDLRTGFLVKTSGLILWGMMHVPAIVANMSFPLPIELLTIGTYAAGVAIQINAAFSHGAPTVKKCVSSMLPLTGAKEMFAPIVKEVTDIVPLEEIYDASVGALMRPIKAVQALPARLQTRHALKPELK